MTTSLVVWSFDLPDSADDVIRRMQRLEDRGRLTPVQDLAVVSWPAGGVRPRARQVTSVDTLRPVSGAFWGHLFSMAYLVPLIDGSAALSGNVLAGVGLPDEVIGTLHNTVGPSSSALLILIGDEAANRLREQLGSPTNCWSRQLTDHEHDRLHHAFGLDD